MEGGHCDGIDQNQRIFMEVTSRIALEHDDKVKQAKSGEDDKEFKKKSRFLFPPFLTIAVLLWFED